MQGGADLNLKPERPAPKNLPDGRCGPCKLIQPTLVEWANEFAGEVELVRFECKKENKEIGSKVSL